jgi:hypothetical protein
VLVTTVAGAAGLLFTVAPHLQPCLGEAGADFTGAPVFPRVNFREHLIRNGERREDAAQEPDLTGAEIRFSYRVNGLRGHRLHMTWSLVEIERDGTLGAVVPGQDRALATIVVPDGCAETGGKDLFVPIPEAGLRYRAVLELYSDDTLSDRLDLIETPLFRG